MRISRAVSLFYFVFYGALGVWWPYVTLFLQSRGMAAGEITLLLGFLPAFGLVMPPLSGMLADAWHLRGWLLRATTLLTALTFIGFFFVGHSHLGLWLAMGLFALFRSPLNAFADASAFEVVKKEGVSYGRLRVWGSLGFMITVLAGGVVDAHFGIDAVLVVTLIGLVVAAIISFQMPAAALHHEPNFLRKWRAMLSELGTWLLLGAVALAQIGSSIYDGCFTLKLDHLGAGPQLIGIAWSIGTLAEVFVMNGSARIFAGIGLHRSFAIAIGISGVRWIALGYFTAWPVILLLQPLHAISFGVVYAGGVTLMRERARPEMVTAAMGLFGAACGLGGIGGLAVAGTLFEKGGAKLAFNVGAGAAFAACAIALFYRSGVSRRDASGVEIV